MSTDPRMQVVIDEHHVEVVVNESLVEVVSVGIQGPPGPPGQVETATAPLAIAGYDVRILPGTVNGQGLIWTGSAWENRQVVPAGQNGTVPYKAGTAFAGDDVNLRYVANEQALYVTKIEASVLDGGNF